MSYIKDLYQNQAKDNLMKEFEYQSVMQLPKIDKVVINMGLGSLAAGNSKVIDDAVEELKIISGQQPIITYAKKSVAGFKLREGQAIGVKVTLRKENMYNFLDKLVRISLPRVRDFQGISPKSFDGQGSYTLGIKEQIIFPEIDYDKVTKIKGMDITIVTTAQTNEEGLLLLSELGFPFQKRGGNQ